MYGATCTPVEASGVVTGQPRVRCDAEAMARVRVAFEENFQRGIECGASLSIWQNGVEKLHLFRGTTSLRGGQPWDARTLVLVWSATKGPSSACVIHALHRAGIALDEPVSTVWPEFSAGGKSPVTFRILLSHQAGLAALRERGPDAMDHDSVARSLAAQAPLWKIGTAHGYGPRTFGYLLQEIMLRVAGVPLGEYWQQHFARPHQLDFHIGLPPDQHDRVAEIIAPRASSVQGALTAFERAISTPGSLTHSAFSTPRGLSGVSRMNAADVRSACLPALGGIGSAQSLARFYSLLIGDQSPLDRDELTTRYVDGPDLVLQCQTAFSLGFMLNPTSGGEVVRDVFGPGLSAFGHPGAGGSLAFADPDNGISFAYTMNLLEPGAMPRERTQRLVRALYLNW